jgi:uncharacterized membrane protein
MAGSEGGTKIDTGTLLIIGLVATALFWGATWLRQPQTRRLALRGAALAIAVALALGVTTVLVAILLLHVPADTGLIAGSAVGLGYLWLNLVVLGVGLWFRPSESWALGAVLATPVVLAAIGFGYASYRAWPLQ